jgi:Mlc titration factor MtfA (ptsG expression regulator)
MDLESSVAVVLAVLVILLILYYTSSIVKTVISIFIPLSKEELLILDAQVPYFRRLTIQQQRKFAKRVRDFMDDKDFVGRGMPITTEMKVLISATAVQITFGLPHTILLHFRKVYVYPDSFHSRNGAHHKGEVNPGMRAIVLSWKHFKDGSDDPTDGVHLGLHEMAHALWLEDDIPNYESGFLNQTAKKNWTAAASAFVGESERCKLSIFRNYGCTNTEEFFAVAVEHFFEKPEEFSTKEGELYSRMVELLGQDPYMLQH